MPSWGHDSPMFVNGKLFVLCESGLTNLFPVLVCIDGKSGEILWQCEVAPRT